MRVNVSAMIKMSRGDRVGLDVLNVSTDCITCAQISLASSFCATVPITVVTQCVEYYTKKISSTND